MVSHEQKSGLKQISEVEIAGKKMSGNFPHFFTGALVLDARALSELFPIVDLAGERLPLRTADGKVYSLLNPLPLADCVSKSKSDFTSYASSGRPKWVTRYEFDIDRLPRLSLFKTDMQPDIFVTEGWLEPNLEFKIQVEQLGLVGLTFREVWNDDGAHIAPLKPFEGLF